MKEIYSVMRLTEWKTHYLRAFYIYYKKSSKLHDEQIFLDVKDDRKFTDKWKYIKILE